MTGKTRHYFPGNNTPEGFFSYYQYILDQKEAEKIFCIKGGPGVGKSTFMRQIAEDLLQQGEDVDFLHCSSDPQSLDGILLRKKKVALIDGTAPHIVDPINPGAVDTIIHLGDYWNEAEIRKNKARVLHSSDVLKEHYARGYGYLAAAGKMHQNLNRIYEKSLRKEEFYKEAAGIINKELTHKRLSPVLGKVRKQFASAITPKGCVNYIDSLTLDADKVYLIQGIAGMGGEKLISLFLESALYRGYDGECFYCPMQPSDKPEHLYIPQLKTAFVSSNRFHPLTKENFSCNVVEINLLHMLNLSDDPIAKSHAEASLRLMEELINKSIECFREAKNEHDILEENYIPNMDFGKLDYLRKNILKEIKKI